MCAGTEQQRYSRAASVGVTITSRFAPRHVSKREGVADAAADVCLCLCVFVCVCVCVRVCAFCFNIYRFAPGHVYRFSPGHVEKVLPVCVQIY